MQHHCKRLFSLLLAVLMVVSMLPSAALADNTMEVIELDVGQTLTVSDGEVVIEETPVETETPVTTEAPAETEAAVETEAPAEEPDPTPAPAEAPVEEAIVEEEAPVTDGEVETTVVAKIGDTDYATLAEAITAANTMTGYVTVEIYGKAEYTAETADLTGAYDSISFVGKSTDAEISITRNGTGGYISGSTQGNDCTVNFTDLILSKPTGAYADDAGFMNVYFTVYRVGAVNYTNCTFPDGACAQGCPVTYTKCDFANQTSGEYSLWVYANTTVTVTDSEFTGVRGAKMYGEGAAKTGNLVLKNTTFTESVTEKPAIVLTYGQSVTLDGNTYPTKGTFELDLGGDPNGTTITADAEEIAKITCVNDKGVCGVLVDGAIYTTVAQAAEAAESGSTVTLLHDSNETVELGEGVTLNTNGHSAENVTAATPATPVEVGTFDELVAALANGGEIKLTADITVDTAITAPDGTVIDLNDKTLYVNVENSYYNNVTIKNGNIVLGKDDVHVCDGYFLVNAGKTLVLNDVKMTSSDEGIKGYAVFHLKTGANLDLISSDLNISDNEYTAGYVVYASESTATVDITGTALVGKNVNGIVHATTVIDNSNITIEAVEHGINRSGVTINDSTVTISGGTGRGITAEHGNLNITGTSVVTISEMGEATIELRNNKNLTVADTTTVTVDAAVNNTTSGTITGTVTVKEPISGTITSCLVDLSDSAETFITSEINNLNATESVVIMLYSGETQIATTTLQKPEYYVMDTLGVKIIITGESSSWTTEWAEGMPRADFVPDKVELYVDGQYMNSANVPMTSTNGELAVNWAEVPGVNPAPAAGTITPVYTRADGFWGEGGGNATKSLAIELYEGETKIATSTLNNIDSIIDGDVYVTWSIPFAGSTDEYWTVEWAEGYPKYDMAPTKGVMVIDGNAVAESAVQFNAPDNLNKIVALAEGYTGGVQAYTSLTDAIGNFNGRKVNVLRDVTESIENFNGCTLTTNVEGGVTVTSTYKNWVYANDLNIGKGVTLKADYFFYETDGVNTVEGTLEVTDTFYQGYDAKTTVQNGGNIIVGGAAHLRYNKSTDAGLYIYGDGDDSTVEFDCDYYIGAYSGTFYAQNANIETGYFLLKNSYDDSSYANIDMTLDNSSLTVVGTTDGQDSFIIDDQASLTLKNNSSIQEVTNFNIEEGTDLTLSIDETSSISATNVSIADDVPLAAEIGEDGTVTFTEVVKGLSGSGTEVDPYLINNLDELKWFRDTVNDIQTDGSNQFAGTYFKLTSDIDLYEVDAEGNQIPWEPIGSTTVDHGSFYGSFDGDGHTISNLYVNTTTTGAGFFAKTSGGGDGPQAVVKNLIFNNVDVTSTASYVGGVIANAGGNTVVSNVKVTGNVYVTGYGYVGGIVGHGYPDMTDCSVEASEGSWVHANYWCAGGIIGYAGEDGTTLTNCSVSGLDVWSAYGGAAAVAGLLQYGNTLTNVSASNVEVTSASDYCMGYIAGNGEESTMTDITVSNVSVTANDEEITSTDAVAKIGDSVYFDLADAIAAVQEGETVTLLRDITLTNTVTVAADDVVTIDLNGKTIDGIENCNIALMSYGDLTVMDSSEEQTGAIKAGKTEGKSGNTVNICGGSFTLESGSIYSVNNAILVDEQAAVINILGGTIKAEPNTTYSAALYISSPNETVVNIKNGTIVGYNGILLWNNTTLNMTGGSVEGQGSVGIQGNGNYDNTEINISGNASVSGYYAAIYHPQAGDLNISGDATLTGWTGVVVKGGNVNISGGTISGTGEYNEYQPASSGFVDTGDGLYVEHYDNSTNSENYGTPTVTVTGGTITSANGSAVASYANSNNNVEALDEFISGGSFNSDVSDLCVSGMKAATLTDSGLYEIIEAVYVAVIGETGYETLDEAVAAAADGATITLVADVMIDGHVMLSNNGSITLDLNGYSILASETFDETFGSMLFVYPGTYLTIEDSAGTGSIDHNGKNTTAVTVVGNGSESSASLTVNSGTLKGYSFAVAGNGGTNRGGTDITINGGTLVATSEVGTGIFHPQAGTLTVWGGTIEGASGIEMRAGTLLVNDGTINATAQEITIAEENAAAGTTVIGAAVAVSQHATNLPVSVTINGGDLSGAAALYEVTLNDTDADKALEVNGGTLLGNVYSKNITGFISGGTFNAEPATAYIAEGFSAAETNAEGMYTIVKGSYGEEEPAEAVAYIDANNNGAYDEGTETLNSVANALAAATSDQIVRLNADATEGYVIIPVGVTLDIQSYTLNADYVIGVNGSNVIDTSDDNSGTLVVPEACIVLSENNAQLPIWTGNSYIFVEILKFNSATQNDGTVYIFQPVFEEAAHQYLSSSASSSNVQIAVRMSWKTATGIVQQDFIYIDDHVSQVINSYNSSTGKYNLAYRLTLTNVASTDFTLRTVVLSDTGAILTPAE